VLKFIRKNFLGSKTPEIEEGETLSKDKEQYFRCLSAEHVEKIYNLYRDYLKHEDGLIDHRISWLVGVQSFLIATFGFAYQKKYEMLSKALLADNISKLGFSLYLYDLFLVFLVVIGVCTSSAAFKSVKAATLALENLRVEWNKIKDCQRSLFHLPGITGGGSDKANDDGKNLSLLLPKFFHRFWWATLAFVAFNFCYDLILLKHAPHPIMEYLRMLEHAVDWFKEISLSKSGYPPDYLGQ
jgi:hypothetical protein